MSRGLSSQQRYMLKNLAQQNSPLHELGTHYFSEKMYFSRGPGAANRPANKSTKRALRSLERRGLVTTYLDCVPISDYQCVDMTHAAITDAGRLMIAPPVGVQK